MGTNYEGTLYYVFLATCYIPLNLFGLFSNRTQFVTLVCLLYHLKGN
jgi:hypothetical protein